MKVVHLTPEGRQDLAPDCEICGGRGATFALDNYTLVKLGVNTLRWICPDCRKLRDEELK